MSNAREQILIICAGILMAAALIGAVYLVVHHEHQRDAALTKCAEKLSTLPETVDELMSEPSC